jgi:hypothetical protein
MYRCPTFPSFFNNRPLLDGLDYSTLVLLCIVAHLAKFGGVYDCLMWPSSF